MKGAPVPDFRRHAYRPRALDSLDHHHFAAIECTQIDCLAAAHCQRFQLRPGNSPQRLFYRSIAPQMKQFSRHTETAIRLPVYVAAGLKRR